MRIEFRRSFLSDLKGIRDQGLLKRLRDAVQEIEQAPDLGDIRGLRRLREEDRYYRARLGDYRIGLVFESDNTVVFVRFLHRKDVYRYFP